MSLIFQGHILFLKKGIKIGYFELHQLHAHAENLCFSVNVYSSAELYNIYFLKWKLE